MDNEIHDVIEKLRTDNEALVTSWENTMQDNKKIGDTIDEMRKVLEFYADDENYVLNVESDTRKIMHDRGKYAREVLSYL